MFLCIKVQKHYHNKNIPNFLFHILILIIILEKKRKDDLALSKLIPSLLYQPFLETPPTKTNKERNVVDILHISDLPCQKCNIQ